MAKLGIRTYIETGRAKFSFDPQDPLLVSTDHITPRNMAWYRQFVQHKAALFRLDEAATRLPPRHLLDLIGFCRFALGPHGILRIDDARPADGWAGPAGLAGPLQQLGFALRQPAPESPDAPRPIEALKLEAQGAPLPGMETLYVIGDSHVRFLAGKDETTGLVGLERGIKLFRDMVPGVVGLHLGAGLAWQLGVRGSSTAATEKIEYLLDESGAVPRGARVVFSFGEVDCRAHVCQQAERQGRPVEAIVEDICARVIAFLDSVAAQGFRPVAWGPIAPTWLDRIQDPRYPVYGSFAQRKAATLHFNATLARLCAERGHGFLTVAPQLFGAEDGITDKQFYCDPIHLSQNARPFLYPQLDALLGPLQLG
jgi:hypothetical protein